MTTFQNTIIPKIVNSFKTIYVHTSINDQIQTYSNLNCSYYIALTTKQRKRLRKLTKWIDVKISEY